MADNIIKKMYGTRAYTYTAIFAWAMAGGAVGADLHEHLNPKEYDAVCDQTCLALDIEDAEPSPSA